MNPWYMLWYLHDTHTFQETNTFQETFEKTECTMERGCVGTQARGAQVRRQSECPASRIVVVLVQQPPCKTDHGTRLDVEFVQEI